jgi:hypothetical protein
MSPGDWSLFRVRPANSPVRRLEAMSGLLLRYRAGGLLGGIAGLIEEAAESGGGFEEGLRVSGLGGGRVEDIVTNVLLPFAFARNVFRGEPPVNILNLFRRYRVRAANSLEKHMMGQLGLSGGVVNSAVRRQGLIKIYRDLCTRGRCGDCFLGKFQSGDDIKASAV